MRALPFDYALRNLGRRRLRTALTGGACALVAFALAGAAAFAGGLDTSFRNAGREDVAILLSSVAERDVVRSTVAMGAVELVAADVPGIVRAGGVPAVSAEIHMGTNLRVGAADASPESREVYAAFVRGITPRAFVVHDGVTVIEGHLPGPGEVLVGRLAATKSGAPEQHFRPGGTLRFEGGTFTVAGVFASPGTTIESEIWARLPEIQGLSKRDDASAIFVKVERPDVIDDLAVFATRRRDLELVALPSTVYYKELAEYFRPIRHLAWIMAILVGLAVLATGANTLNAAVQDRVRELATLRAVGYTGFALARSLLEETVVLTAAGGLIGVAAARLLATGAAFRIGMGAFSLAVDGPAVLVGTAGVLVLGFVGAVPAITRIARLPVSKALKEG